MIDCAPYNAMLETLINYIENEDLDKFISNDVPIPTETKIAFLNDLLVHYENVENYEMCQQIIDSLKILQNSQ